jgi:hypothetical protein
LAFRSRFFSGRSLAIIAGLFQRLLRRTLHGALADERVRLGVGAHALARDASVSR